MYKKILLIDDDEDEQFFFTEALKEINAHVKFFFAANSKEGIDLLKFLLPDIVFIDINMPALNGFDCLEIIKDAGEAKNVNMVIYSTGVNEDVCKTAIQKGAITCIKKQATIHDLAMILQKILL